MAVAYGAVASPGLLSQQYPPPLLPKPGKENVRLQKLLKRTAKKKAAAQASQTAMPFRSSLSPVNEASPDLEHSDHSTPPKTPETPFSLYSIQQPPRFTVRPLYQHVASPYPQRAAYGRAARFSPQTVAMPSYSYSQHVTTVSSYSASTLSGGLSAPGTKSSLPASAALETRAAEGKTPVFSTSAETPAGLTSSTAAGPPQPKPSSPYPAAGSHSVVRPLTVLTPLNKSKSPRPTFKATEPSRSPKLMFDVPQIRMYTASTSYYETSRTPPVYDSAGLTAIGSAVPQSKTATDTKQDLIPASELRRGATLMAQSPSFGPNPLTLTAEAKRGITPTAEINSTRTSTPESKRATPTPETRVKTPTYDFQTLRTSAGRPKTPAYHMSRAATPVFEISRPNPLLFAVSPITVESERSKTPKTDSATMSFPASQGVKTAEPQLSETVPNGDIHLDVTPAVKPVQQSVVKSKSEPNLSREKVQTAPAAFQRLQAPTSAPTAPAGTSYGYQRPKTPTYEASRLMTTSPGYKRPKTPTYGASPSGASPVAFQRPKTPTQVAQKSNSAYRGLTPAEYAAYGGIKTYSPTFGISDSMMQTEEGVKATKEASAEGKTASQEPVGRGRSKAEGSKETPKDIDKPCQREEEAVSTPSVPLIIVSQASDSSGTTIAREPSTVSSQDSDKQKPTIQETPKAKTPTAEGRSPVKQKMETAEPKTETRGDELIDPLRAVRKLLGKDKVQTAKQTNADASDQKQPVKPAAAAKTKAGTSIPRAAAQKSAGSEDKGKDSAGTSAPERKDSDNASLTVPLKPKGLKPKLSGWSRLKKHMVVEQEEPKFPEVSPQKEVTGPDHSEEKKASEKAGTQDENQNKDAPKAMKMWDAVLFQMFSSKENIMHQIELNKSEPEMKEDIKDELKEIPSFAYRLPVLLFSPKFDAKRLKEAASRPVTKISTVFEMGLIGRKGKEEEPKDFNRTARGFTAT
ncbi:mucin-17 [Pempheris klunzingeri]|uniref:mucin-17 n=1 Tax=Pempheris klunzingeri TaxID=3127111 RepID=UPI00397F1A18